MRKLKFHEQKLLKKVDFLTWKQEENLREIKILRRYYIQDREDYVKCVLICDRYPHRMSITWRTRQESANRHQ